MAPHQGTPRAGVRVEIGGQRHDGTYAVGQDAVTVQYGERSRTVPRRGADPASQARAVLRQLVLEEWGPFGSDLIDPRD